MLSKPHRFHGLNALNFTYKRGQVVRSPLLALKYARNNRRDTYRVAVVVSRKVDKSSVVRNRIRRRIYETVRLESENITEPYDIIFSAYNVQLATLSPADLTKLVRSQLRKAGILRET